MADRPVFTIDEWVVTPTVTPLYLLCDGWMVVDDTGELRFAYGSLDEAIRRIAALAQTPVVSEESAPKTYGLWRAVFNRNPPEDYRWSAR
jgi:hypothetical protein